MSRELLARAIVDDIMQLVVINFADPEQKSAEQIKEEMVIIIAQRLEKEDVNG